MPAPVKSKPSTSSLAEGNCLQPCRQSIKIAKCSRLDVKVSQPAVLDISTRKQEDAIVKDDHEGLLAGADLHFAKQHTALFGSSLAGRSGSLSASCPTILGTIFSPSLEPDGIDDSAVAKAEHSELTNGEIDDHSSSSSDYQTYSLSDLTDAGDTSLAFGEDAALDDLITSSQFQDYECEDPNMTFGLCEGYMVLPFLEESIETGNNHEVESLEEAAVNSDDTCLYLAIQQVQPSELKTDVDSCGDLDESDGFDPHLFLKNYPDISESVPSAWSMLLPREAQSKKPVTLVLDLDETLVHSTLDYCEDADFTFHVYFNMKEHTVYVRQRPHLRIFLERVAEMFEIIVFTASQSIYAAQLLDILDPEQRLISRRVYRESCIFSDGGYTKDLTVLGLDLAKVVIIDNSPQVFRLQVNNGIPIQSWFDDPSDCALISLIPFLETLVNVEDVRPIIAQRFNNKE